MKMPTLLAVSLLLTSCVRDIRIPVTGRAGGQVAFGYANVRLFSKSNFVIDNQAGLHCEGEYEAGTNAPQLEAEASCNDGRTVHLIMVRNPGKLTGVVRATLSDGMKAQFVYGRDVRYEDVFPGPDETAPAPMAKKPGRSPSIPPPKPQN